MIKIKVIATSALLCFTMNIMADCKDVIIRVLGTSDIHGCFFPYDFIERKPMKGSLARVSHYVNEVRRQHGENVILLDNGDILHGPQTSI